MIKAKNRNRRFRGYDYGKPLVTIIITNYNYASYIEEAIHSALNQTYKKIEILIIDDGSTDESNKIITKYIKDNKNTRYIRQKNQGVVFARNKGLKEATGEFILFLDGDDRLPNEYVESLVNDVLEQSVDVVYTDYQKFGNESGESNFPDFDFEKLKRENFIHVSALINRNAVLSHRFDKYLNNLSHEDWDFFLGIAFKGAKFKKNKTTKLLYRTHKSSRSLQIQGGDKEDYGKQALKSVESFFYIINKYKNIYPGEIRIYEDSEIVKWGTLSFERLRFIINLQKQIKDKDKIISDMDEIIKAKDRQISGIINSRRYKIGRFFITPLAKLKLIVSKRGKNG